MALLPAVPTDASRARAASSLLALAGGGLLTDADLRDLGRVILGRDLDAAEWPLHKLGKVRLPRGTMVGALRSALDLAFRPQAIRLGERWITSSDGTKDCTAIPADLAPRDLARWLRTRCHAAARGMAGDLPLRRERKAPRSYRSVALALMGEYSRYAALGPEACLLIREALVRILDLVDGRARDAVLLVLNGFSRQEAAQRVGVTERSVRRYLQDLRDRVTKAGILDGLAPMLLQLGEDCTPRRGPLARAA